MEYLLYPRHGAIVKTKEHDVPIEQIFNIL